MKKFLLLCAVFVVVAIAAILAAGLNPDIQTRLANAALKKYGASIESVSAGFSGAEIRGIRAAAGYGVFEGDASLQYSLASLLSKKLKASGKIENATFEIRSMPKANLQAASKEPNKAEKTGAQAKGSVQEAGKAPFELPIDIEITRFTSEIAVVCPDRKIATKLSVKNALISSGQIEFELSAQAATSNKVPIDVILEAKKIGKVLNARLTESGKDIMVLTSQTEKDLSGSARAKITISNGDVQKLAKALEVKLPKAQLEFFAESIFNPDQKRHSEKLQLKAEASGLKDMGSPVDSCAIAAEVQLSQDSSALKIPRLFCSVEADGEAVANLANDGLAIDVSSLKKSQLIKIGSLTLSIPPRLIGAFVKPAEFSAQNISAVFDISANIDGDIAVSTPKRANFERINISKDKTILVDSLTFFASCKAKANIKTLDADAEIKAESAIVDGKSLTVEVNAAKKGDCIDIQAKAAGCANPVLYSINSISSNIDKNLFVDASAKSKLSGSDVWVENFNAKISGEGTAASLDIAVEDPFKLNAKTRKFYNPFNVRIKAREFPFAPLRPFCAGADAKTINLDAAANLSNQKARLSADFDLSDFSFTKDGDRLLEGIGAKASLRADANITDMTIDAEAPSIELSADKALFCSAKAKAALNLNDDPKIKEASVEAQLQPKTILMQPCLSKFDNLARCAAALRASFDADTNTADIDADLSNLAVLSTGDEIQNIKTKLKLQIGSPANLTASVEMNSKRGATDARAQVQTGEKITAKISAKSMVVDDLLTLKSAFSNPNAAKENSSPAQDSAEPKSGPEMKEQKDARAFWDTGKDIACFVELGELKVGNAVPLRGMKALVEVEPGELSLENVSAKLSDGNLCGALKINFDPSKAKPYKIAESGLKIENIDAAKLGSSSILTGIFNAQISLSGEGLNARNLAEYITGSAVFTCGEGSIKLISDNSDMGKTISIAQSAAKLINAFVKSDSVDRYSAVADKLKLVNFSSAKIELSRSAPDYNILIPYAQFEGNELVVKSQKSLIYFDAYAPVKDWEMEINLNAYIRNRELEQLLGKTDAFESVSDMTGYRKTQTFKITGTIGKPKSNLLEVFFSQPSIEDPTKLLKKIKLFQ